MALTYPCPNELYLKIKRVEEEFYALWCSNAALRNVGFEVGGLDAFLNGPKTHAESSFDTNTAAAVQRMRFVTSARNSRFMKWDGHCTACVFLRTASQDIRNLNGLASLLPLSHADVCEVKETQKNADGQDETKVLRLTPLQCAFHRCSKTCSGGAALACVHYEEKLFLMSVNAKTGSTVGNAGSAHPYDAAAAENNSQQNRRTSRKAAGKSRSDRTEFRYY